MLCPHKNEVGGKGLASDTCKLLLPGSQVASSMLVLVAVTFRFCGIAGAGKQNLMMIIIIIERESKKGRYVCVCVCVCVCVWVRACVHACVRVHVCVYMRFSVGIIILSTLLYNYVPVLNYCNVSMFYNSYFMHCFASTCFILNDCLYIC